MDKFDGSTGHLIKALGISDKPMVKVNLFILIRIFIKVIGQIIKPMGPEYLNTKMAHRIQEIGSMIYSMEAAFKHGMTDQNIKDNIDKDISMAQANIHGMMGIFIKEIGTKIKCMNMEYLGLLMEEYIKVNGKMALIMDLGNINGKMESAILGIFKMIKNMDMAYLNGKIIEYIKDGGLMGNSMALVFILFKNVN